MMFVVVDSRDARRLALSERYPLAHVVRSWTDVGAGDGSPRLALAHVGEDQNQAETFQLRARLETFLADGQSWIAAYTGGFIDGDDLPPTSDFFVVRKDAPLEVLEGPFDKAVRDIVGAWETGNGVFAPGQLGLVWLGLDPVLEAKLRVLATLLENGSPLQEDVRTLDGQYPDLRWNSYSSQPAAVALKALRDRFFGQ